MGGGQPGDTGTISWDGGSVVINDTRHGDAGAIRHLTDTDAAIPDKGTSVTATLDWDRRYLHMRMHTALHLLGSLLQYGVTGGNISATKSRLDFDMEDTVDKEDAPRRQFSKPRLGASSSIERFFIPWAAASRATPERSAGTAAAW